MSNYNVGPHIVPSDSIQCIGVYIADGELKGEEALVYLDGDDAYAQFDNRDTGKGLGWWRYPASAFELTPMGIEQGKTSLERVIEGIEDFGCTVLPPLESMEKLEAACAEALFRREV